MNQLPSTAITLSLMALAASTSSAQERVYTLENPPSGNSDFGRAVADAGDVDGDGVADVIVGAPFHVDNGVTKGAVFIYSGKTGGLIWSRVGDFTGDAFGWSVDGIGDIDGDGKSEVIVGAPLWDNNNTWDSGSGKAYILRGANGTISMALAIHQLNAGLGYAVRGLGDITGDGMGDFAISIPKRDTDGLTDNGDVSFWSGGDLNFLFSRSGEVSGANFGHALDVVRATGNQATSRLIIGEPGVDGFGTDNGQARLMDGYGNTVITFSGQTNQEWFGSAIAGLGDVNADGFEDFAIAAPYADILFVGADAGLVRVYSGFNNSVLFTVNGGSAGATMGQSISACGDFDGDGHDDIVTGAPNDDQTGNDVGEARVTSGATALSLASWFGGINDHMGRSVSGAGDLNLDGLGDVIVGANEAPFGSGQAYVHLAGLDPSATYCSAKVNSQGCTPEISIEGTASLSIANDCIIRATDVINQKFGILFWGSASNNAPFQGGLLCVQAPLRRTAPQNSGGDALPENCSGSYEFHFSQAYMSSEGISPGTRVHAQFWSRDPASSFQVGLTDAVSFDVIP